MRHPSDADELLEVACYKLGAVVGNDARSRIRVLLTRSLKNNFYVEFLNFLADLTVYDGTAKDIENDAHEVKSSANVEIADVDMPVLMRFEGLVKAGSFLRGLAIPAIHHAGIPKHTINRRRAHSDNVCIEHHEG